MKLCRICRRKFKPYRNKEQKFCSKKCRRKYHTLYCGSWREKLTEKEILRRRKRQLEYYYAHKQEHNARAKKYYYTHLKEIRIKQNARNYANYHKDKILKLNLNKCKICKKAIKNKVKLHHKDYKNRLDVVFPFHKECHTKFHQDKNRKKWKKKYSHYAKLLKKAK